MLHEVAASDLELSTIVNPLRKLLRRVNTFVGSVEAIDLEGRRVQVSHGLDGHTRDLPYDQLILALGSSTNFFGLPGVERCALTVKSLSDAIVLRNRLITHLVKWYKGDFLRWQERLAPTERATLVSYVTSYLPPEKAAAMRACQGCRLRFVPYDWRLNDQNAPG